MKIYLLILIMSAITLITISGQDRPGITAMVTGVPGAVDAESFTATGGLFAVPETLALAVCWLG